MAGKIIVGIVYFVILLASIAKFIFEGYSHQTLILLILATVTSIALFLRPSDRM